MSGISIIIPSYNRTSLLKRSLQSILDQSVDCWEVIVVIDGGNEQLSVEEWTQFLEKSNGRIRACSRVSALKGASVCRNIGASMARYNHFTFLDSDDLLMPWCVESRVRSVGKTPANSVFWFYGVAMAKNGLATPIGSSFFVLQRLLWFELCWQTSSILWEKSIFNSIGGFDEKLICSQDWDIHLRLLLNYSDSIERGSLRFDFIYDKTNSSLSQNRRANAISSDVVLFEQYLSIFNSYNKKFLIFGAKKRDVFEKINVNSQYKSLGMNALLFWLFCKFIGYIERISLKTIFGIYARKFYFKF